MLIAVISSLFLVGCSVKDDRLFQNGLEVDEPLIISDKEYEAEVQYEYKIAQNDRLRVTVYIQSSTDTKQMNSILASRDSTGQSFDSPNDLGLLVTQKGTIRLPLVNSIKVIGLTEDEAAKLLIEKYKIYIKNPYVKVEITNQRIIVVGEVNDPGVVPIINGTMNLIEVLSSAGYLNEKASRTDIMIIRGNLRNPEIRKIDLTDTKNLLTSNLLLKPNDIVYVQARQMSGYNKAFQEIAPFFQTITTILTPFVTRKTLQEAGW